MIALNIGYKQHEGGYSTLSNCPIFWDEPVKSFLRNIRYKYNIKTLFRWAKDYHVPPSLLCLFVTLDTGKQFKIHLINVREYKKHWDSIYKKG
ncbi:MAG: hypothetical protein JWP71_2963 [Mucilaginibacter sp.]|nr:hypothetical protein [Mucilaginibacter sp.]